MKLTCIIVDDEPLAVSLLVAYVAKIPTLELSGTFSNALEAGVFLEKQNIDLMFLDVQMPQMTGLEFLKSLEKRPMTIISTAFREYAFDGYEFDVVDFLLKPILFERFEKAVGKSLLRKGSVQEPPPLASIAAANFDTVYMYFKVDREMVKVLLKDILWIESMKDYVKIKTTGQGQLVTYQRISYLEEKLPEHKFLRTHRSFIVNKQHIQSFNTAIVTINNKQLPIGRLYKAQVVKVLQKEMETV